MEQLKTNPFTSLLDAANAAFLFVDEQVGLLQTVHNMPMGNLRTNVAALAKAAHLVKAPVISTGINTKGSSGIVLPEIADNAPGAVYVDREHEINAWDNAIFRRAVKETKRKALIVSGIWTSVCLAFPCLSALREDYAVYAVTDTSGDVTKEAHDTAFLRMVQAGVVPVSTNSIIAELQNTWNRVDADQFRDVYASIIPDYRAILELI
jgi:nicotinamidase-related amidase